MGYKRGQRHSHSRSVGYDDAPGSMPSETVDAEASGVGRSNTTGKSVGAAIKSRLGSNADVGGVCSMTSR